MCSECFVQNSFLNGGKKAMLFSVCQAPETYSNLKALFTLLNAPGDLEYVYACGLKVVNMAAGPSSHSSRHPADTFKSDTVGPRRTVTDNSDVCRATTFDEDVFRKEA